MDIILKQIVPFHRLTYIQEYIERSHKYKEHDPVITRKIHFTFLILFLQALHFLYQFFFSDFQRLGIDPIIDYIRICNLPREVYLFLIGICALSAFFLYMLYCGPFEEVNDLLYQILILRQDTFFVKRMYGKRFAYRWAQIFVFVLLNLFQGFMVVVDLFVCITQTFAILDLYPELLTIRGCTKLVVVESRLLLYYSAFYLFTHSHMIMALVFIATAQLFIMKLNQIYQILPKDNYQFRQLTHCLNKFRRHSTETLLFILRINPKFGWPFCGFLVLNCPLNAIVVSAMITGKIPLKHILYTITLALQQQTCNLGIHWLFARVNIHRFAKQFIKLNMINKPQHILQKFKLDHYIHAFHTRKKYGFTYLTVGRISMFAFVKYLLLYSELLLFYLKADFAKSSNSDKKMTSY